MSNLHEMKAIDGSAWVFGDNINTDLLVPGAYMRSPLSVVAQHCLEAISPEFATNVRPDDIVLGGKNFGMGSSREQAPQALLHLGVGAVVAKSFARIFYRNAINLGLPLLVCADVDDIETGHRISLNIGTGTLLNHNSGNAIQCDPMPPFLIKLIQEGGLLPSLKKRLSAQP
jgi:3-isopropylmalate/(R)-2-methylmalate dehydratase small subunit